MKVWVYILLALTLLFNHSILETDYSYHFFMKFFLSQNELNQKNLTLSKEDIMSTSKEDLCKLILALQNEVKTLRKELNYIQLNKNITRDRHIGMIFNQENTWKEKVLYLHMSNLDKIKVGDFIIHQNYFIGMIEKINNSFAVVRAINNKNNRISVLNVRNNSKYILSFSGRENLLKINYIDVNDPPLEGDILTLDTQEPDILVAIVTSNINYAQLPCSFNKIKYVEVIADPLN